MFTIEEYQEIIQQKIASLDIVRPPHELYDPIQYTMNLGGKRLRPTLCLLAAEMFGASVEDAICSAIAIEVFHNFTLIHDDIMDEAPIRRGKMSVYRKWNENIAILSGDAMMAMAYQYLLKTPSKNLLSIIETFNKFAIEVCEGQQFDMNFETKDHLALSEYINMIRLKTSVLIAGSLKIGALIGDAGQEDISHLYHFGENIGIAFQLKDDYLDVFSQEDKFGKQTGGDILTNKKTFLYLKAYELADIETKKELNAYFFAKNRIDPKEKIQGVKAIYQRLKVKDATEIEMQKYYQVAISFLDKIRLPDEKKVEITTLADKLMVRDI
jgi:geranylgeranyl diphosphate synthase type II